MNSWIDSLLSVSSWNYKLQSKWNGKALELIALQVKWTNWEMEKFCLSFNWNSLIDSLWNFHGWSVSWLLRVERRNEEINRKLQTFHPSCSNIVQRIVFILVKSFLIPFDSRFSVTYRSLTSFSFVKHGFSIAIIPWQRCYS